jgi:hypothetical protein
MDPSPLFIFSMHEPPHFFNRISDPPAHIMAQLGTLTQQLAVRSNDPQRHRLPCLGDEHKPVAGNSEAALYFELPCSRIFRNKQAVVTSATGFSPSKLFLKYRGWSFGRHKYTHTKRLSLNHFVDYTKSCRALTLVSRLSYHPKVGSSPKTGFFLQTL